MISKIFILLTSFIHHDTVEPAKVHPVVTIPEDEIVIENVRPELASVYY